MNLFYLHAFAPFALAEYGQRYTMAEHATFVLIMLTSLAFAPVLTDAAQVIESKYNCPKRY